MHDLKIEPIKQNEFNETSEILSRAFIETPLVTAIMRGRSEKLQKKLQAGFNLIITRAPGKIMVAKDNGNVVGAIRIVEWPDCQKPVIKGWRAIQLLFTFRGAALRLKKQRDIWGQHDPKQPHLHVDPLGVKPENQGMGIGSRLLQYYCDEADRQKTNGYLETDQEANVRLYERFGFEVKEQNYIFDVKNYYMLRPARV